MDNPTSKDYDDEVTVFKFDPGYYELHKADLLKRHFKILYENIEHTIFVLPKGIRDSRFEKKNG